MFSSHFFNKKQNSQPLKAGILLLFLCLLLSTALSGCQSVELLFPPAQSDPIRLQIEKSGQTLTGTVAAGTSVEQALTQFEISFQPDDVLSPPASTLLQADTTIRITAINFQEETSQRIVPFKSQTVRNESIPEGETYIIQAGQNGLEEITTKSTYEDGELVSKVVSSRRTLQDAVPEILMYGIKAEHAPIQIPGKLIYVSNGGAWMLEGSTGSRTPLVTSGDLDGRVLDLSSNGEWLLYTRKTQNDEINSLWMLKISDWNAQPVSLRIENVIHFAAWLPGESLRVLFSTVTPQESAPGWRANNDLRLRIVSDTGMIMTDEVLVEENQSGEYSWWGTEFHLSSDGRKLLYADPGSIGEIDRLTGEKTELAKIQPYEKTRSDWAWVPGVSWSSDESALFFTYHGAIDGNTRSYDPTDFNIGKILRDDEQAVELKKKTGLFSYPVASPAFENGTAFVAFMQAISPLQSESSRYRLMLMGEDGLNIKIVFPLDEEDYITPQQVIWAPTTDARQSWIALSYQNNLWLVNPFTGIYNQITIDQSVSKMIWE